MFHPNLVHLPRTSIQREFPNKLDHVIRSRADLLPPRDLHPAFYGSFDWHSAVHGHWCLVRLLKLGLDEDVEATRHVLRENLTEANLRKEAEYLDEPGRLGFERPYGWTWLLRLAHELKDWDDADGRNWRRWLMPLEERIAQRYIDFLPKQAYPIRVGTHGNTAFGLLFALDYARAVGHDELERSLVRSALRYFGDDGRLPTEWEPSGADFLSPALVEADLMRRVLHPDQFKEWYDRCIGSPLPRNLLEPAVPGDRSDGQLSHLDGLNLSRAWNLRGIATAIEGAELSEAADINLQAGMQSLDAGTYEGDHWLGSFACLALYDN